jgi:hypothetical protein
MGLTLVVRGLALYATRPPLVAWAMLAYPGGRLASWGKRVAIGVALVGAAVVLLPALFSDATAGGCAECPENLLRIRDEPGVFDDLNRVGVHLGLVWSLLVIAMAAWRLAL